ncbi:methylthioribose-1-phosphate isomerase [Lachnospiraceae bacterium XBB2008]|nr:methylthioribose-1-phosphate isomerase [Lachnospiraceae bacterium XBB2008]
MNEKLLDIPTVELDESKCVMRIIDQTLLPGETRVIELKTAQEIWDAIYLLKVRGAPAIGVAAGYGIYILACEIADEIMTEASADESSEQAAREFYARYKEKSDYLNSARPTAVNLSWALRRMDDVCRQVLDEVSGSGSDMAGMMAAVTDRLCAEAKAIHAEDIQTCRKIGEYGLGLIKPGDGILTHCNAGQLATSKYGTATAPMYLAHEKGYGLHIYCDETRPLLQGARLTAHELAAAGMDVTLQCDNMAASLMKQGKIDAIFVGCDRMAANGDFANKIGTLGVAVIAARYNVPFYVCVPVSSIDMNTPDGSGIVIEQRPDTEVTEMWYEKRMAPEGINVYNPAFDVTDHELVTAVITERGIARAPFDESLRNMMNEKD